ncbi:MAG: ribosome recycling factor [Oscillospiraceae bacterium]
MITEIKQGQEKMEKSISNMKGNFAAIRAGRANPAILDKLTIDYYGTPTPIQQLGTVSVAEARTLVIQPWEKNLLKDIEKAIQASDIGINPTNDGNVLRLTFPMLTEERRKEICKQIKKMGEETKIAIRNIRRDVIDELKALKKANEITEDDQKNHETEIQKITDNAIKKVDDIVKEKENEILSI